MLNTIHNSLLDGILKTFFFCIFQENLQKEAFEALQLQKDAKTQRITSQIAMIEQELIQLTMLEVEQRDMRLDTQVVSSVVLINSSRVLCQTQRLEQYRPMIFTPQGD